MKRLSALVISALILVVFSQSAEALTITSPKENEIVYAGSQMTVIAKTDPGEDWVAVSFGFDPMTYNPFTREYKITVPVPKDYYGYYDNLIVIAGDKNNKSIQVKRAIFVKLPPDVVLKGIIAGSSVAGGLNFISLRKMPAGSKATDIENNENEQLSVHGQYSDNVNRIMTSAASGTTYTSSDEKIVTVSPEGKVTAQGIGKAKVTVKNGKHSATVDVVVKPYK